MKKIVSGMIAVMLLVFTMGTTVFASPSPNGETAIKEKSEQLNNQISQDKISCSGADGKSITVEKKALNVEQYNAANLEVAKQNGKKNSEGTIMAMTDLSVPQGTDTSKGIKMTLAVSGVMKGDNIVVLHRKSDGTWGDSVGNCKCRWDHYVQADFAFAARHCALSGTDVIRW